MKCIKYFILIIFVSCQSKPTTKMTDDITYVNVYCWCTDILDSNNFRLCQTIINRSPISFINKEYQVDSIIDKNAIKHFQNHLLSYEKMSIEDVQPTKKLDGSVAFVISYDNGLKDSFYIIYDETIQLSAEKRLHYKKPFKSVFKEINIKNQCIDFQKIHFD